MQRRAHLCYLVHQMNIIHWIITGCETNTGFGHIFLPTAWKTSFFSFVAQPPDKGKDDELQKRSHIWLCDWLKKYINVWLFKKTWKSNRAPGNRVTFCQKEREREREREKWSFEMFFLMKRTKAEESRVLNSHFLREWERARCGCDVLQRLRAPSLFSSVNELQASHYTEQQRAPGEMLCGYYTLLPPACQTTHLQIQLDWPLPPLSWTSHAGSAKLRESRPSLTHSQWKEMWMFRKLKS